MCVLCVWLCVARPEIKEKRVNINIVYCFCK